MSWLYTPVAIHLSRDGHKTAASGIFVLNTETREHYVLSVTDVSFPERHSYKLTSNALIGDSLVYWIQGQLVDVRYFKEEEFTSKSSFFSTITGLQFEDKFKFKPGSSAKLAIVHLKITQRVRGEPAVEKLFNPQYLKPVVFSTTSSVEIPAKIIVECCPFSLTNTAMFINHLLFGSVNYKTKGLYFSDVRYLDDIIGSNVKVQSGESLGLVAGALSKTNGDGEILVIVSWDTIFEILKYKGLATLSANEAPKSTPFSSVVRISVQSSQGSFWGSGVVLSPGLIVTNRHVVQDHAPVQSLTVSFPYSPKLELTLDDVDIQSCLLQGFDLCFLKLRRERPELSAVKFFSRPIEVGQSVQSIGYGLFFNRDLRELRPFVSEGHVNKLIHKQLDLGVKDETMMIVSAACWNGSSGGGLFSSKGELMGLMTSNGKLSSGEVMPNFTLAIPVSVILKAMELTQSVKLAQVEELWSLKSTHVDVDVETLSWKL